MLYTHFRKIVKEVRFMKEEIKTLELDCPKCGAILELDISSIQAICPYCGRRILVDSYAMAQVAKEHEKTHQKAEFYRHKERMADKRIQAEKDSFSRAWKKDSLPAVLGVAFLIFCIIFCAFMGDSSSHTKVPSDFESFMGKNYITVAKTFRDAGFRNVTPVPTQEQINNSNPDDVIYVAINGKRNFTANETVQKSSDIRIYFFSPDGMIKLPVTSTSIKGTNYYNLKRTLELYGFTNIQMIKKDSFLTGLFTTDEAVIGMTVHGNDEFSEGERFMPDTEITITYYKKQ